MTSKERVTALFAGSPIDRPPVFASTLAGAALMCGVPQGQFHQDPALLARCLVQASRELGLDGVYVSSDNAVMHGALGGEVLFPEDDEPWAVGKIVREWSELGSLKVPDPKTAP
ncbi:MAG TPA: uroporphyrinogen decarboxylase family protein [Acidobacteriota bacterium]|nr:uroporphyrinogen decarboxylase family protein [Acidobacteriota bacterium]